MYCPVFLPLLRQCVTLSTRLAIQMRWAHSKCPDAEGASCSQRRSDAQSSGHGHGQPIGSQPCVTGVIFLPRLLSSLFWCLQSWYDLSLNQIGDLFLSLTPGLVVRVTVSSLRLFQLRRSFCIQSQPVLGELQDERAKFKKTSHV